MFSSTYVEPPAQCLGKRWSGYGQAQFVNASTEPWRPLGKLAGAMAMAIRGYIIYRWWYIDGISME